MLVMGPSDTGCKFQQGGCGNRFKSIHLQEGSEIVSQRGRNNLLSESAVLLHERELVFVEPPGFEQDRIADANLADVVQHCG